jgi:hypothetical protein
MGRGEGDGDDDDDDRGGANGCPHPVIYSK